jgi:hypothetical protein
MNGVLFSLYLNKGYYEFFKRRRKELNSKNPQPISDFINSSIHKLISEWIIDEKAKEMLNEYKLTQDANEIQRKIRKLRKELKEVSNE